MWRERPPPASFTQNIEERIQNLAIRYGWFSSSGIAFLFKDWFYKGKLFISECLVIVHVPLLHTKRDFVNYLLAKPSRVPRGRVG